MSNGGPQVGPMQSLSIAISDMSYSHGSVVTDLIMVQVISMVLAAFILLVTEGPSMGSEVMTWVVAYLMLGFTLAGTVYRRLSN